MEIAGSLLDARSLSTLRWLVPFLRALDAPLAYPTYGYALAPRRRSYKPQAHPTKLTA